jgi:hypothetical protein
MAAAPAPRRISFRGRLAAVVFCGGAVVTAFAGPAAAGDEASTVKWSGRSDRLAGWERLRAQVSTGGPIDGWILRGLDASGTAVFDPICEDTFKEPRQSFEVKCRWDTTRYSDGRWSANQHYLLRVEARRDGELVALGSDHDTSVDNPASRPADVQVAYDPDGRRAVVSWSPNPEPDIERYHIEEKIEKEGWRPAGESTTTSFERQLTEPGPYRFRVAAQRRRPDGEAGRPGESTIATGEDGKRSDANSDAAARPPKPAESRSAPRDAEMPRSGDGNAEPSAGTNRDADRQTSGGEPPSTAGGTPAPSARTAPAGPGRDTPPATAAAPAFPASSGTAFQALALPRPAPKGASPAAPPASPPAAPAPEPDDGFDQALPYRDPQPEATAEVATPLEQELEAVEPAVAVPVGGGGRRLRRLGGIFLLVLGASAMVLARPGRHRIRAGTPTASAAPPVAGPGDLAPLHDFECRLQRLESAILRERTTSWVVETGQLPTG